MAQLESLQASAWSGNIAQGRRFAAEDRSPIRGRSAHRPAAAAPDLPGHRARFVRRVPVRGLEHSGQVAPRAIAGSTPGGSSGGRREREARCDARASHHGTASRTMRPGPGLLGRTLRDERRRGADAFTWGSRGKTEAFDRRSRTKCEPKPTRAIERTNPLWISRDEEASPFGGGALRAHPSPSPEAPRPRRPARWDKALWHLGTARQRRKAGVRVEIGPDRVRLRRRLPGSAKRDACRTRS